MGFGSMDSFIAHRARHKRNGSLNRIIPPGFTASDVEMNHRCMGLLLLIGCAASMGPVIRNDRHYYKTLRRGQRSSRFIHPKSDEISGGVQRRVEKLDKNQTSVDSHST
ncbi:hypothetical protein GCK32_014905 [Trichostrongylus colubriformis]|uniref:Uncharacterized protein n=1 Tax=Trichostrongylus colubriformis TaxID=6319 RepID=A0AAN8EP31_TRICO